MELAGFQHPPQNFVAGRVFGMPDKPQGRKRELPVYATSIPEAGIVAELTSVKSDLELVIEFAGAYKNATEDTVKQALYYSAVIAYRRAFNRGDRGLLESEIASIPDAMAQHRYIRDLADKLVAHSVNAFEENKVGVILDGEQVMGLIVMSARLGHEEENFPKIAALSAFLLENKLQPRLNEAMKKADAALKVIPASQHRRSPGIGYSLPPHDAAGRHR